MSGEAGEELDAPAARIIARREKGNMISRRREADHKTWSTWSAVINLTPRTGELRSASSWPDARHRVAGKRALALGGARSQGHNTGLRGLAPCTGFPLNCRTRASHMNMRCIRVRAWPFPCERAPPRARALLPATRSQSSGPLGALLSSPALDVRLITALQVLQVRGEK